MNFARLNQLEVMTARWRERQHYGARTRDGATGERCIGRAEAAKTNTRL
jgi:hypothetical protein